jgi:hypothetical protein
MALTEHEERELLRIAEWFRRNDPRLARRLAGPALPTFAAEWVVMAAVAAGLAVAAVGAHWHLEAFAALGVVFAVTAPVVLSIRLSQGKRW